MHPSSISNGHEGRQVATTLRGRICARHLEGSNPRARASHRDYLPVPALSCRGRRFWYRQPTTSLRPEAQPNLRKHRTPGSRTPAPQSHPAASLCLGCLKRIEPRVGMKNLRPHHHRQSHQFRITPLVANDGCARNPVDVKESQRVAWSKEFRVPRREMDFVIAKSFATFPVEHHERVIQTSALEGWGAY